jgi:hypothetical protein
MHLVDDVQTCNRNKLIKNSDISKTIPRDAQKPEKAD